MEGIINSKGALDITESYVDSLLGSVADMLIIFDDKFTIRFVNNRVCQLLNFSRETLLGQDISQLFLKRSHKFLARLQKDVQIEEHVYNRENRFRVRNKKSLPVSISFSILKDNDRSIGYVLLAKDIKQFLLATDALEQKNEELKTLVYRVSHDLKGPLASVTGLFELLDYEDEDIEVLKHYLKLIKESTRKLERTLNGLLELGLSTNVNLISHGFNVRACIEDIIQSFEGYPGRENVIILLSANPEININTEEKVFRSIIQNLIENSIKYRKHHISDAVTKVSARKYKNGIKIKVKDNGQGMSRQIQQRAFDMFYRGNQSSEGSGLGLFIVKSNVEKLGGEIKIKSQIDHGTEMWVYLPSFNETRRNALVFKKKQ